MPLFRRRTRPTRRRPQARGPSLECLEDRCLLSVQAVSLADPSLFATGAVGGTGPDGHSISFYGRYVLFSAGDNIIPGDHNYAADVFVRDLQTGAVTPVSVTPGGRPATPPRTRTPSPRTAATSSFTARPPTSLPGSTTASRTSTCAT